jgi:hypothetical protein
MKHVATYAKQLQTKEFKTHKKPYLQSELETEDMSNLLYWKQRPNYVLSHQ